MEDEENVIKTLEDVDNQDLPNNDNGDSDINYEEEYNKLLLEVERLKKLADSNDKLYKDAVIENNRLYKRLTGEELHNESYTEKLNKIYDI